MTFYSHAPAYARGKWSAGSEKIFVSLALSCPTNSFCAAGGVANSAGGDTVVTHTAKGWRKPTVLSGSAPGIGAVSCASSTMCFAGSYAPHGYRWNGSGWGKPLPTPTNGYGVAADDCPTAGTCILLTINTT